MGPKPEQPVLIERADLIQTLRDGVRCDGHYVVVVGPCSAGKSVLAKHAFQGQTGVVHIILDSTSSPDMVPNLMLPLRHALGVPAEMPAVSFSKLAYQMRKATEGCEKELAFGRLVVVVDVSGTLGGLGTSGSITPAQIKSVAQTLKTISCDLRACRAVLVLSDSLSSEGLPPDPYRQLFLFVGDMEVAEANMLLDKLNVPSDVDVREFIFNTFGRRPGTLNSVCTSDKLANAPNPSAYMAGLRLVAAESKRVAETDNLPLIRHDASFAMLAALLLATNDTPVPSKDAETLNVPPLNEAAAHVRKNHLLQINMAKGTYAFASPLDRTVAQEWFEDQAKIGEAVPTPDDFKKLEINLPGVQKAVAEWRARTFKAAGM
jgi:hypothetical protein